MSVRKKVVFHHTFYHSSPQHWTKPILLPSNQQRFQDDLVANFADGNDDAQWQAPVQMMQMVPQNNVSAVQVRVHVAFFGLNVLAHVMYARLHM